MERDKSKGTEEVVLREALSGAKKIHNHRQQRAVTSGLPRVFIKINLRDKW
jgi:hypothetical protein